MKSKSPIPRDRQEDVLHMLWMTTGALESIVDGGGPSPVLDRELVTAAFNILNQMKYTEARPIWEQRPKISR